MDKRCQNPECGKVLVRRDRESAARWAVRLSCGERCRSAARRRRKEGARPYFTGKLPTDAEIIANPRRTWREWAKLLGCSRQMFGAAMKKRGWERTGGQNSRLLFHGEDVCFIRQEQFGPPPVKPEQPKTWKGYTLPRDPRLAEEFKASIKRRGYPPKTAPDRVPDAPVRKSRIQPLYVRDLREAA